MRFYETLESMYFADMRGVPLKVFIHATDTNGKELIQAMNKDDFLDLEESELDDCCILSFECYYEKDRDEVNLYFILD